jgi:hypothetical protein
MPFLEAVWRLAVRAVKGAGFAFTGAKRKPLTEEADGLGAGFLQEGQCEGEKLGGGPLVVLKHLHKVSKGDALCE